MKTVSFLRIEIRVPNKKQVFGKENSKDLIRSDKRPQENLEPVKSILSGYRLFWFSL